MRGRVVDGVSGVRLGLGPEVAGAEDHGGVVGFRVGGTNGSGLAVGGAAVVEEVEAVEEECPVAALSGVVGGAGAHYARADHDHVEFEGGGGGGGGHVGGAV